MPAYTETAFETAIEEGLVVAGGYLKRQAHDFDEALALFPDDVIGFIRDSQPKRWEQLEALLADKTRATVLDSLAKELTTKGALHVLRHGFKCYGKSLRLAYFRPNSGLNPDSAAQYAHNRLSITRQVAFASVLKRPDGQPRRCIIDVTLAVNGLPVATAELKNPLTGQRAADAVAQYQRDRDRRDLLFAFKQRALVHFAVDPDEVWMTTRLKGRETVFLPFNRGYEHGAGKANNLSNFSAFLEKALDELFIDRMEGNEDIFSRVMTDKAFRNAAQEHLAREIFDRVRGANEKSSGELVPTSESSG